MRKSVLALALLCCPAHAQGPGTGPCLLDNAGNCHPYRSQIETTICSNIGSGCVTVSAPPSDLVIRTRDGKVSLIRRVGGCASIAAALKASADVEQAECFK